MSLPEPDTTRSEEASPPEQPWSSASADDRAPHRTPEQDAQPGKGHGALYPIGVMIGLAPAPLAIIGSFVGLDPSLVGGISLFSVVLFFIVAAVRTRPERPPLVRGIGRGLKVGFILGAVALVVLTFLFVGALTLCFRQFQNGGIK